MPKHRTHTERNAARSVMFVRMPQSLKTALMKAAADSRVSLNAYVIAKLSRAT